VKRAALPLIGSALLVAVAALRLPRPYTLLRVEENPFRRTVSPWDGPLYALAGAASASIPAGARVEVESPSATPHESALCAMVVQGLLPGRQVRPGPAAPEWMPQFRIRLGHEGARPTGRRLFRLREGEVWSLAP